MVYEENVEYKKPSMIFSIIKGFLGVRIKIDITAYFWAFPIFLQVKMLQSFPMTNKIIFQKNENAQKQK